MKSLFIHYKSIFYKTVIIMVNDVWTKNEVGEEYFDDRLGKMFTLLTTNLLIMKKREKYKNKFCLPETYLDSSILTQN